ncbi:aldo/keto reductase [Phenylobacterium sp. J367]|uniref:aldo/keto reductase n=1 Tax=Phenylobacterium sp. J367 TaxID=2898435 RepID=UPI00215127A4|nr:aldo/keto reductase [Phenylobacterium sp. J367]MCR5877944.1 aldo/keto reductase [Phenylobacterium sp. J367]
MNATRRSLLAAAAASALPLPAFAQAPKLITKSIPSSGEQLPLIGVGTARRYDSAPTEAEKAPLRETLKRFHDLGGKVIDTAPSYGQAETVVGDLVSELKIRPGLFLATKVGADNAEAGKAQIEASFQKLKTERIDLIAVHNLRDVTAALATLRGLKQAGRIRYVGATTSFDNQYADFEAMMRRETLDVVQVDYALDNRGSADRILPLARDRGMAVWVNLPFGRGRLFQATQGRPLPDWAKEIDCTTWAQVFLKYVVSHPAVTTAIPGMAQARYVDDNLGAARGRMPDAAMRTRMEQFIDSL